jgi:hypothetical protein
MKKQTQTHVEVAKKKKKVTHGKNPQTNKKHTHKYLSVCVVFFLIARL